MDNPLMDYETLTGTKPQARVDAENLDSLALFHYILGAITAVFSSFFIFHIVMGVRLLQHPNAFPFPTALGSPPVPSSGFPPDSGYMFVVMGAIAVLAGWTLGSLTVYAGRCLKARKKYLYIQVVAGLNCAFVQGLGTVLGVFTFIVLYRPTVKALFERSGYDGRTA